MKTFYGSDILEMMLLESGETKRPVIRPYRNMAELERVYRLTHDCYVASDFCEPHPTGMVIHYPQYDHIQDTTILVAILNGQIVGSVSVTFDGPGGFTVDDDFKDEVSAIRDEGEPVAVVWRFVIDKAVRENRLVVLSLIHEVVTLLESHRVKSALFSVNPKHELIYKRMLNMEVVARKEMKGNLKNLPAVLLRGDPANIPQGEKAANSRPIYNPIINLLASNQY